ncbi:MAG: acyl-CoA dehydrogenase family protein [Gammaproteobacteria bacterium]|nr:acyl-CoA dehydrogenase family protein [Gammaproteobacteria bacterium]MDE0453352.1 acyl-CoA dehydrogenase family protein [Gammaproteobacteria bacterium]
MDFSDTPEEAAFRQEARAWLTANVPSMEDLEGLDEVQRAKLWQMRKYEDGWACIRWPREYGGRGASAMEQVIWNQEESSFRTPASVFAIGQGMAAPTMMAWATEEQKRRYLPPLASGEHVWCQLFSEPAGGSDLAALRTRAEKDGDEWVVNGQKIWTSGAHFSDYAILVVRTDPEVPKHKGLTYFFVDMKSPGIETKPIRQISGESNFNEVYFTDVRIPDDHRLGAVGQGWQVAITTLMNERLAIGGGGGLGFRQVFELAQRLTIDGRPAIEDRSVRARLADWYAQESGLRFAGYRAMSALSRGEIPGPENSIGKYVGASKTQDMASFAIDLLEMSGVVSDPELSSHSGIFQYAFMGAPGLRIAGGTDEIMLNILAERVLGMPQDVRVDKGIPFSQVPTGAS